MAIIGGILTAIGTILILIYGIIILIIASQKSILWGLGCLFVPFCSLVFVIMHWDDCKKPFLKMLVGIVLNAVGVGLLTPSLIEKKEEQAEEQAMVQQS